MYKIGELIFYGSTGVCRVEGIEDHETGGESRKYYVLKPTCQDGKIYIPVDSKVYMRPVISREEAEQIIDAIPGIKAEAIQERSFTQLAARYDQLMAGHDCEALVRLVMSIYAKKQYAESHGRKFGQIDARYMKRAETLLYGELSAALGLDYDKVQPYIAQRVSEMKS